MLASATRDTLKESLGRLGARVLKLVADPGFKPRTDVFLRRTVNEMVMDKDDIPIRGVKSEDHLFEKPSGISADKYPELTQLFQETINAIAQLYGWQKAKAESWTRQFVSWLSKRLLSTKFDQSVVNEGVQTFMADLEKAPAKANVRFFLLGITPRQPSISIGDNLTIRKVSKQDLCLEYDVAFPPPKQPVPHSIAETSMDVHDRIDLLEHQRAANKLVSILKLFKPWSVYWTKWNIDFPTTMPFGDLYDISYPMLGVKSNILEASDQHVLEKLYSILLPMMPKHGDLGSGTDSISIAYRLYSNSLINKDRSEWRLATAVAGLDALYVKGGVDQTYKLAHRAAKLLGLFGEDPEKVRNVVKESYSIRSSVFHGDKLKDKQPKLVPEYLTLIHGYLRKSILLLLFLTQNQGISKETVIKYIDNSLIGISGDKELKKMLKETEAKIGFDYEELGLATK